MSLSKSSLPYRAEARESYLNATTAPTSDCQSAMRTISQYLIAGTETTFPASSSVGLSSDVPGIMYHSSMSFRKVLKRPPLDESGRAPGVGAAVVLPTVAALNRSTTGIEGGGASCKSKNRSSPSRHLPKPRSLIRSLERQDCPS